LNACRPQHLNSFRQQIDGEIKFLQSRTINSMPDRSSALNGGWLPGRGPDRMPGPGGGAESGSTAACSPLLPPFLSRAVCLYNDQ
jgi:hypothetical protein